MVVKDILAEKVVVSLNNVDRKPIYADNQILLNALRNLKNRNEITLEQYAASLRRAKDFHSHRNNQAAEITEKIIAPYPQKSMLDPSGVFNLILKSLGVDYIG